jgi:2-aminophenol/2-amino-5-chlorophenol 1,6-dioxygenase alpha subunit
VVAAYLLPGSPLPLMRRDNPPWKPLVDGYAAVRRSLSDARPDTILVYSAQWVAVLDQLWQTRPRLTGLHVDENWHELGNLRYDIRIDASLARDCAGAATEAGIRSKTVDYEGFPIDTGTIVIQNFVNPNGEVPLVVASNNIYHSWQTTKRLGELAVGQAIARGKRVAVIGVGSLSASMFRDKVDFAADRIAQESDDILNRDLLHRIEEGSGEELENELPAYCRQARPEMGLKHLAFILGALGGRFSGAKVHGYAPVYGAGAAIIEFQL